MVIICPINNKECNEECCGWYNNDECSIVTIANSLENTSKSAFEIGGILAMIKNKSGW